MRFYAYANAKGYTRTKEAPDAAATVSYKS
jgi:hypothetical protein